MLNYRVSSPMISGGHTSRSMLSGDHSGKIG